MLITNILGQENLTGNHVYGHFCLEVVLWSDPDNSMLKSGSGNKSCLEHSSALTLKGQCNESFNLGGGGGVCMNQFPPRP